MFGQDHALVEGLTGRAPGGPRTSSAALGTLAGSAEAIRWGFDANRHPPVLHTHDRFGHRIDEVEYHPSYHRLMAVAVERGLHAAPWRDAAPGAHVARAAGFYLWSQVDAGHGCPISMTYSVLPALRASAGAARRWEPRLTSPGYDPSFRASGRQGGRAGRHGHDREAGRLRRAGQHDAWPMPVDGGRYRLTGHKWFCSAPMCDVFLVLAQAPGGLSCFALPRWTPDGERNRSSSNA